MRRDRSDIADELLVLAAQDGDTRAMNALVRRWNRRLLNHALTLTRQSSEASDAVQEAWLAIVRGIRSLHDPAMFKAWAYRIVTHKCADLARREQRQRRKTHDAAAGFREPETPAGDSMHGSDSDDELITLRRAIQSLPAEHRALLSMFYTAGMTVQQVADALKLPAGTVKSRLHHLRRELRAVLERQAIGKEQP